jgi:DNA polymerase
MTKEEVWQSLLQQIATCQACGLSRNRKNPVPGEGSLEPALMLVGEGPGANEDLQGRPFVGEAGKLLDRLLAGIHLTRRDVFIGNTVKCRPPNNRAPTAEELACCKPFLIAQIAWLQPKMICVLGNSALNALIGPQYSISKVRGQVLFIDGMHYMPTYHPAAALYRREVLSILEQDFTILQKWLKEKKKI